MRRKDKNKLDDMYDEEYEELSYEEFQQALEAEPRRNPKEKKKKQKKRLGIRIVAVVIAVALVFQTSAVLFDTFRLDAIEFLKTSYKLSQDEDVQEWKESVVTIEGEGKYLRSQGTGFFIKENGLVLTNHHVIENQDSIGVSAENGEVYEAELIKSDEEKDLALLDVEGDGFNSLSLRKNTSDENKHIYVIGNPLSFTKIANEGRVLGTEETGGDELGISAPIYKGNSGSPIITEKGEVTGVVYAKRTLTDSNRESIGLAVSIEDVHTFLDDFNE
ncbi:S1-C subfamily serine protease [Salibacterium salarium]|uniref:S1C family serine protease n=1 Tax=Salibacterium salarium TaxID=284579 RepID=UPI002786B1A3|nr:serine protease [Salibacterium salarium]MDQ0299339.1 S1-C subfamily serine protease [Salibacterium salarium]